MNKPNKLEYNIALNWKGLVGTNTRDYWAHLYRTKKINCCDYVPWTVSSFFGTNGFNLGYFLLLLFLAFNLVMPEGRGNRHKSK